MKPKPKSLKKLKSMSTYFLQWSFLQFSFYYLYLMKLCLQTELLAKTFLSTIYDHMTSIWCYHSVTTSLWNHCHLSAENFAVSGKCPFYLCLLARNSNLKNGRILRDFGNSGQRILMSVKVGSVKCSDLVHFHTIPC